MTPPRLAGSPTSPADRHPEDDVPSPPPRPRRAGSLRRRRTLTAWLFLAPSLTLLAVFTVWPMLQAAYLSMTDYNLLRPPTWAGAENYTELVKDPAATNAFGKTMVYTLAVVPVTVVLALLIAVFLNQKIPLRTFFRTAVFLPFIVSLGIISYAWTFMLDPNIGLISYWLGKAGLVTSQSWLSDPDLAMVSVAMVGIWKNVGFYTVIYLAGLQSIPAELLESAAIDGAGRVQRFYRITVPLLANQTMIVLIIAAIATLQAFDQIYVMTQGGPYFQTETLVMLIYRIGFQELRFGYAAAISWVLLLVVLFFSVLQFLVVRRRAVKY